MKRRTKRRTPDAGLCGMFILPLVVFSSPMISVDNPSVDVGIIHKERTQQVTHTFIVKNTGDSVLVIDKVRPG